MEIGAKVSISLRFAIEFRCLIYLYILNYSNFILRFLARNNINNEVIIISVIVLQPGEEEGMTEEVLQKVRVGQIIVFFHTGCE